VIAMSTRAAKIGAVSTVAAALAGCGGSASNVVNPPTQPPTGTTSASPTASRSAVPGEQHVTVTPANGLSNRQRVLVVGRGFSPNESLVVTECAAKGTRTGAGDCNLTGLTSVTSDADGSVRLKFTVVKGPFGSSKIVCGRKQPCLISVTQATLSPTEEADASISFR